MLFFVGAIFVIYLLIAYRQNISVKTILKNADINVYTEPNSECRPWDILVKSDNVLDNFLTGSLGFAESYMRGEWDCADLKPLLHKLNQANLANTRQYTLFQLLSLGLRKVKVYLKGFNRNDARCVALQHYDLPRVLYQQMLDSTMNYSCAYYKNTDELEEAQLNKIDLVARKMKLDPGMSVLDIGCGWGSLAWHMVSNYNVNVVAITISNEQYEYCIEKYKHPNLTFMLTDYRDVEGKFDRIVSVGMFEHVTSANYNKYFSVCEKLLKAKGLVLVHTITGDKSHSPGGGDRFIMKYIFPNSQLPTLAQITKATAFKFVVEDVHNFGLYYAKTLAQWYENFDVAAINIKLKEQNQPTLTKEFVKMWHLYLLMSEVGFESRKINLHQIVLSRGQETVYEAIR